MSETEADTFRLTEDLVKYRGRHVGYEDTPRIHETTVTQRFRKVWWGAQVGNGYEWTCSCGNTGWYYRLGPQDSMTICHDEG